jgi:histidine ammonia-lyase
VAAHIRSIFASGDDEILASHVDCGKVQDPYSLRCVPQVHGACRDVVAHVAGIVEIELNSVTDNPLVFDSETSLSGGNFHGQPIAMALDYLAIAMAEIGSISERRTEKITNPHLSGLPAFVARHSGLNSGFMIPHVVAASLVSENKVLCHPASVDSIPTSADKEDHVSMGPIAARKARQVIHHTQRILAIEILAAAQGIDLLKPLSPNLALSMVLEEIRTIAPEMEVDRSLAGEIEATAHWISTNGPSKSLTSIGVIIS